MYIQLSLLMTIVSISYLLFFPWFCSQYVLLLLFVISVINLIYRTNRFYIIGHFPCLLRYRCLTFVCKHSGYASHCSILKLTELKHKLHTHLPADSIKHMKLKCSVTKTSYTWFSKSTLHGWTAFPINYIITLRYSYSVQTIFDKK